MFARTRTWWLNIGSSTSTAQGASATRVTPPSRKRQFSELASSYGSLGRRQGAQRSSGGGGGGSATAFPPMGSRGLTRPLHGDRETAFHASGPNDNDHGRGAATPDRDGFVSQRQRHRRTALNDNDAEDSTRLTSSGAAASVFSPLPKKYGFYDGIDAHALEPRALSRDARQERLRQALEQSAVSVLELTDEAEADMDLGGLPESEYHGQSGWTTISTQSSLYNSILARDALESRQRANTWSTARRRAAGTADATRTPTADGDGGVTLDAARRQRRQDDGQYNHLIEGELLAPVTESVGQPRSVYAMRKLFVQGLVGYQGIISRAEESAIAEELLHLLQGPRAGYVAEEARYCVNLYERELGIPGKDTLAFAMSTAPTLQRVLMRFFLLGLIPSIPNVCQISEMTGNFSGYPVHRKPASIGGYFGLLNLVSTSLLYMQHVDCPWYPRVHMTPRSLFVFTDPCLSEYKTGYKWTHQPFHTFDYATRVSKDYRIEVMFATVEVEHQKHLHESIQLTDYATAKAKASSSLSSSSLDPTTSSDVARDAPRAEPASTDEWLTKLRERLHDLEKSRVREGHTRGDDEALPLDGHKLREALQARHLVGQRAQPFDMAADTAPNTDDGPKGIPSAAPSTTTAARRRLAALKDRHALAETLRQRQAQGRASSSSSAPHKDGGPQLIRGHSPHDDAGRL